MHQKLKKIQETRAVLYWGLESALPIFTLLHTGLALGREKLDTHFLQQLLQYPEIEHGITLFEDACDSSRFASDYFQAPVSKFCSGMTWHKSKHIALRD